MSLYEPLVSIIINVRNNRHLLPEALTSACAQTYKNREILVYDNASEESLREVVEKFPEVRYHRREDFVPLGTARNAAIEMARGDLLCFLDSDDLYRPEKLERQVPLFENERVAVVFSNTLDFHQKDGVRLREKIHYDSPPPQGMIFERLLCGNFISFVTTIFRRSAVEKIGGSWFEESFEIITDFDLYMRLSREFEFRYVDEVLCEYRWHESNTSQLKMNLTVSELQQMLGKMLLHDNELMTRLPTQMMLYLAFVFDHELVIAWRRGQRSRARSIAMIIFRLTGDWKNLVKWCLIPFCPYDRLLALAEKMRALSRR